MGIPDSLDEMDDASRGPAFSSSSGETISSSGFKPKTI